MLVSKVRGALSDEEVRWNSAESQSLGGMVEQDAGQRDGVPDFCRLIS